MLRVGYGDSDVFVTCRSSCVVNSLACVHSRGHIFSPIIMKLGQNVYLDKIWDEYEMGHVRSKTRSNLRKTLYRL